MSTDILLLQLGPAIEAQGGTTGPASVDYRAPGLTTAGNLGTAFFDVARGGGKYPPARTSYAPGARVALPLSNSPEYLAAFYGTLLADCVAVPLPVSLEEHRRRQ